MANATYESGKITIEFDDTALADPAADLAALRIGSDGRLRTRVSGGSELELATSDDVPSDAEAAALSAYQSALAAAMSGQVLTASGPGSAGFAAAATPTPQGINLASPVTSIELQMGVYAYFLIVALDSPLTITVNNAGCTQYRTVHLVVTNPASATVNWPTEFKFPGGVDPTLYAAAPALIIATTINTGASWNCMVAENLS